jgi:hypothetical protein
MGSVHSVKIQCYHTFLQIDVLLHFIGQSSCYKCSPSYFSVFPFYFLSWLFSICLCFCVDTLFLVFWSSFYLLCFVELTSIIVEFPVTVSRVTETLYFGLMFDALSSTKLMFSCVFSISLFFCINSGQLDQNAGRILLVLPSTIRTESFDNVYFCFIFQNWRLGRSLQISLEVLWNVIQTSDGHHPRSELLYNRFSP